jgi:hypothetical protein
MKERCRVGKLPESGVFPNPDLPDNLDMGDVIVYQITHELAYGYVSPLADKPYGPGLMGRERSAGLRAMATGGEGFRYFYRPYGRQPIILAPADYVRIRQWDFYFKNFGGGR